MLMVKPNGLFGETMRKKGLKRLRRLPPRGAPSGPADAPLLAHLVPLGAMDC